MTEKLLSHSSNLSLEVEAAFGIVYVPEESQILFLRREDNHKLEFPGGGLNDYETQQPIQGVLRELEEETAITIKRYADNIKPEYILLTQKGNFIEFYPLKIEHPFSPLLASIENGKFDHTSCKWVHTNELLQLSQQEFIPVFFDLAIKNFIDKNFTGIDNDLFEIEVDNLPDRYKNVKCLTYKNNLKRFPGITVKKEP